MTQICTQLAKQIRNMTFDECRELFNETYEEEINKTEEEQTENKDF